MNTTPEQEIEKLDQELQKTKDERDTLNQEALKWAKKRNLLHEEIKSLRQEAGTLREKRDILNSEVQHLKMLRDETAKQYREKIERLKKLRQRLRGVATKRPDRSAESLKKDVESIDWEIQTNPLSLEEERKLVEEVKALESQLEIHRRIRNVRKEIEAMENEFRTLRDLSTSHHEKIQSLAEQSQGFHQKMLERLESTNRLRKEADEMHRVYTENKEKAQASHTKYKEILDQIRAFRKIIREREEEERSKQAADLQIKLEKTASEKLKEGKKLTFEEFKILAEQGKI